MKTTKKTTRIANVKPATKTARVRKAATPKPASTKKTTTRKR